MQPAGELISIPKDLIIDVKLQEEGLLLSKESFRAPSLSVLPPSIPTG